MKKKTLIILALLAVVVAVSAGTAWYNNLYPATNSRGWPNAFRPTSPTAPTVGKGIDLTEHIKSLGLSQEIVDSMSKDINGNPRPPGKWDIGAYQYPQPTSAPPTNLRIIGVQQQ